MVTVLVVEDSPSELALMRNYLQDSGYSVVGLDNAKIALEKTAEHKPDVVITDVVMPGMSGFELCRNLKKNPNTTKIPVIVCTSKDQELDRLWGLKQGADAYVTKPFTQEEILRVVRLAVG